MEERKSIRMAEAGSRFKSVRIENGFTQEQMAEFLGVDRTLIAKFEKGERSLGVSLLEKACRLFGCTLAALDGRQEYTPLAVAFRAKELTVEDMDAISKVQKIVLNMRELKAILKGGAL